MTSTSKAYISCHFAIIKLMENEKRTQESTPVVVAKDILKQTETKVYLLQNKNNKIMRTYLKWFTHKTDG